MVKVEKNAKKSWIVREKPFCTIQDYFCFLPKYLSIAVDRTMELCFICVRTPLKRFPERMCCNTQTDLPAPGQEKGKWQIPWRTAPE